MGKLDNTLIIYICGDNGTSSEGSTLGTPFDLAAIQAFDIPVAEQLKYLRRVGLDQDAPAYGGRLGLGLRHAVQMDEAGRVAFRRHAPGHGDFMARPHQRRWAASAPSSTTSSISCRRFSKPPASRRR